MEKLKVNTPKCHSYEPATQNISCYIIIWSVWKKKFSLPKYTQSYIHCMFTEPWFRRLLRIASLLLMYSSLPLADTGLHTHTWIYDYTHIDLQAQVTTLLVQHCFLRLLTYSSPLQDKPPCCLTQKGYHWPTDSLCPTLWSALIPPATILPGCPLHITQHYPWRSKDFQSPSWSNNTSSAVLVGPSAWVTQGCDFLWLTPSPCGLACQAWAESVPTVTVSILYLVLSPHIKHSVGVSGTILASAVYIDQYI